MHRTLRRLACLADIVALYIVLPLPGSAWQPAARDVSNLLLRGEALQDEHWVAAFSDQAGHGSVREQKTFTQLGKEPASVLLVTGKPIGYLRTKKAYANYVLQFEWRYTKDPNGNSGLLLHVHAPDKIWPQCIQVQMMNAEAGAIFPLSGAKSSNRQPPPDESIAEPVKKWNTWEITSQDGTISLRIKRAEKWLKVGEITGCEPASGYIGFQSEGSNLEIRDIRLRELSPEKE